MKVKKITKEDQVTKHQDASVKKPPFSQWLLHDKTAFKITYLIGIFGGLLVTLGLLAVSLIFDFHIFFKVLFGVMGAFQAYGAYKAVKNHKHVDSTINDLAYKGKYDAKQYTDKREQYDYSKGVAS